MKFDAFESFFVFGNKNFCQISEASMEFQLEPTFAKASLCYYKKQWLSDGSLDFQP